MIHDEIRKAVEENNAKDLLYIFDDCLDGDPTFNSCIDDYEYVKSKGLLFVPHKELTPMNLKSFYGDNDTTTRAWIQLKKDFMKNPSIERMEFMRKTAFFFYADRLKRIAKENAESERKKKEFEESQRKKAEEEKKKAEEKKEESRRNRKANKIYERQ